MERIAFTAELDTVRTDTFRAGVDCRLLLPANLLGLLRLRCL